MVQVFQQLLSHFLVLLPQLTLRHKGRVDLLNTTEDDGHTHRERERERERGRVAKDSVYGEFRRREPQYLL